MDQDELLLGTYFFQNERLLDVDFFNNGVSKEGAKITALNIDLLPM